LICQSCFASGPQISRAQSMNRCATGLMVRFFSVTMPTFAKAAAPQEALQLYESVRKERANAVHIHARERARAMQGWDSERVDPGRDAEDIGMFAYNPSTVPI
jgi:hypothetical protein